LVALTYAKACRLCKPPGAGRRRPRGCQGLTKAWREARAGAPWGVVSGGAGRL